MSKAFFRLLKITLSTLGCFAISDVSQAQVTPDNTLDTRVNRNGNVSEITGGEARGGNLFHSFQDFSVPTGDTASFNNAEAIENIFSRVTGGNISNIDGLIRANGDASLFLINPAGIIFGENARLDLGGSFYGSTADSILFEDGVFSASDLENPPLLTINAPIGLNFRDNPGEIVNRANFGLTRQTLEQFGEEVDPITNITGLEVNPGQNLALIGGNITLIRSGITAPGGNITLGGLSQAGTVAISPDGIFSFPENVAKADLSLENNALVSIIGNNGGGAINVDVGNLTLKEQSQLRAGIAEGAGDINTVAGNITINASDSVTLIGSAEFEDPTIDLETAILNTVGIPPTRVENFSNEDVGDTAGSSGSIFIDTQALNITERGLISTRLYGVGNAGDININADTVLLDQGTLTSQVGLSSDNRGSFDNKGRGNSGDININSNNFTATDFTFVITDNSGTGEGNAGDINLNATDSVVIRDINTTLFISETGDGTVGNAGNIDIVAKFITITDDDNSPTSGNQVEILNQVRGEGNTGSIVLEAADSLVISGDGAAIKAQVIGGGEGTGGDINISANTFELLESAQLIALNENIGNAGDIVIQVDESISASNSEIISEVEENGVGDTGDLQITANSLDLENNARLITQTGGRGNAGSIDLNIADSLVISSGAEIIAQVLASRGEGTAGNISINANTFELLEGTQLLTSNGNIGDAGNIIIQVNDLISANNSKITSQIEKNAVGNAGDIKITANSLNLENKAQLITAIEGEGNTGSIDLDLADSLVLSGAAQIQAQVRQGTGTAGNIEIDTNTLEVIEDSLILADSQSLGDSGDIAIRADESLFVNDSIISTGTIEQARGSSGKIDITSPQVLLRDRAIISSSAEGTGEVGDIKVDAENISLDNFSLITASSRTENSGQAGNITINADRLTLTKGSIINATSSSEFDGGQITINSQVLKLLSGGVLQTATNGDGDAGDIVLNIDDGIIVLDGNNAPERREDFDFGDSILDSLEGKTGIFANVSDNTDTSSSGGNIRIDSDFIVAFPNGNSDIRANARQGEGGNITIDAKLIGIAEGFPSDSTNDINASSDNSDLDGNVVIRSLDTDPIGQPREIPSSVVEVEQTTAQVCRANREAAAKNAFTIEGRGGVRPTPDSPLDSDNILLSGDRISESLEPQPIETSRGKIQLARGIKVTKSGDVILTAYRTNNAGERIPERHNCG